MIGGILRPLFQTGIGPPPRDQIVVDTKLITNTTNHEIDHVIEAAEQCERLSVPQISELRPLERVLADWPAERQLFAAIERSDAPRIVLADGPPDRPRGLLVGPEGAWRGLSPTSIEAKPPLSSACGPSGRVAAGRTDVGVSPQPWCR